MRLPATSPMQRRCVNALPHRQRPDMGKLPRTAASLTRSHVLLPLAKWPRRRLQLQRPLWTSLPPLLFWLLYCPLWSLTSSLNSLPLSQRRLLPKSSCRFKKVIFKTWFSLLALLVGSSPSRLTVFMKLTYTVFGSKVGVI